MSVNFFKILGNTIRYWYIPAIIGIIFILVGVYTFRTPGDAYLNLSMVFSLSFLFSGLSDIILSISNRKELDNWGWILVMGIATTLIGVFLIKNPIVSVVTLPYYVGFLVLFRSISAVGYSFDLKSYGIPGWWNLLILGILGILFSAILIYNPMISGMTIVTVTGISFIILGILSIVFSFQLKKLKKYSEKIPKDLKHKYKEIENAIKAKL